LFFVLIMIEYAISLKEQERHVLSEHIARSEADQQRIALVLHGLDIPPRATEMLSLDSTTRLAKDALAERLVWDGWLNAAILPLDELNGRGEQLFHVLVAHSTYASGSAEPLRPQLRFADREKEHQTGTGNVYGTGFYVGNRREAVVRRKEAGQGRQIGAYLTDALSHDEVLDSRRRLLREVLHLGAMVATEVVAPRLLGERKVAEYIAGRGDRQMDTAEKKLRLLNEAPRGRVEKLDYESGWRYDLVPPQYMLLRTPMLRIGTYSRPEEEPQQYGAAALYGRKFWEAAVRNARDMKRLGVKAF
jgi:hypothetical protein